MFLSLPGKWLLLLLLQNCGWVWFTAPGQHRRGWAPPFLCPFKKLLKSSLPFEFIFCLSHSTLSTFFIFLFDIIMMVAGQAALFSVACRAAGYLCDVSHSFYSKHRAKRNNWIWSVAEGCACLRLFIYSLKENFFVLHRQFFYESKSGAKKKDRSWLPRA